MKVLTIIILVLILLIIISSVCVYFFFKKKLEYFSQQFLGTKDIVEGFKKQELEYSETPKSVSSLDSVMVPRIMNDFPTADTNELKSIAENALIKYFVAQENNKMVEIENASTKLTNHLQVIIDKNKKNNVVLKNMKIHRTVINSYTNKNGACIIKFQSSLEYIKVTAKKETKVQERYNTDLIYIYDETKVNGEYGVTLNCSNCGAPIKTLGNKYCTYCGTGVIEYTSKIWKVNNIYK